MKKIPIETRRTDSGCLVVTNRVPTTTGYIRVCVPGGYMKLHRQVYEASNGPIPPGLLVRHLCDVRLCVEPTHLTVGTVKQNSEDAIRNGRVPHGVTHYAAKLTRDTVLEIRRRFADGERVNQIAKSMGIRHQRISLIVRGEDWARTK